MLKILHTADIHLRNDADERWEALNELVKVGKEKKVSVLAISGDLFDKDVDADNLRPRIREIFSNTGFRILVIPGNHDKDSYDAGMFFGGDVTLLGMTPIEIGDVRITGIPFEPLTEAELRKKIRTLKNILRPDRKNILLCHGELLDIFFSGHDMGDEDDSQYMPFRLSYFSDLNVDYVLAGHFHSKFNPRQLENSGYFIYPGSPVSVTGKETGQRKANYFEIGGPPEEILLNTFHFEEIIIEFSPFDDRNPLEIMQERLLQLHPKAKVILLVKGYVNSEKIQMSEKELVARIKDMAHGKCNEEHYDFRDISGILTNDLFKSFLSKLSQNSCAEEEKRRLENITIAAMMKADI